MKKRRDTSMLNEYLEFFPKDTDAIIDLKAERAHTLRDKYIINQVLFIKSNLMLQSGIITIERWKLYVDEILDLNHDAAMRVVSCPDRDLRIVKLFHKTENLH